MKRAVQLLLVLMFVGAPAGVLRAQFDVLEGRDLRLVYFDQETYLIPHLTRCFENALQFHDSLFSYSPSEPVTILLQDFDDFGSGGTSTMPWNFINVCVEPFDYVYDTRPSNERMNWLMNHELMHVVATDKAAASDRFFRSVFFGKVVPTADVPLTMFYSFLTNPRWYSPRWYHEGIATFLETWMAGGIGRVLGGYDEMVFRTMVRDSSYFYDFVGIESEGTTIDFQIGANSYLYGTRFVSYLASQYGPEKVVAWFSRSDGSRRYYASQFEQVYGIPLDDAWSSWIAWEHTWQRRNLALIRQFPITPSRVLYPGILGSVSRSFFDADRRELYVAVNYPGQVAHIAAINVDNGSIRDICDVPTPALYYVTSLAYDSTNRVLFYSTNNSFGWRDIHSVDLKTGEARLLQKDIRTGDLVVNPVDRAIWGVQHHSGLSRIVRVPYPYDTWNEILALPYGRDVFDLDISPDGHTLTASMVEISGRQQLVSFDIDSLEHGNGTFTPLYEFEDNGPSNFVFSSDGKQLIGTSYYTGVSNIFRFDRATKTMEALTNAETGYFRPQLISADSLIAFEYTREGFRPVMMAVHPLEDVNAVHYLGQEIVERYPVVKRWMLPSPTLINLDSVTTSIGTYNTFSQTGLGSIYPVVEGYKDFPSYGLRANFYDHIGIQSFDLTASYSPNRLLQPSERIHAALDYRYWGWTLTANLNKSDFYDLFGPTKVSRKGYSVGIGYHDFLIYDRPTQLEYAFNVAGYGGLERLPDFQNVRVTFDKFFHGRAHLRYSYLLRTLGAVEYEKGVVAELHTQETYVRTKLYPRFFANLDYGVLLPWQHSTVWLRSSAGYSVGERTDPFANFYFGGFGNNWIDHQEARRYREYYSFPGVELNAIGGTDYGKLLVEWNLPPLRFRRFGLPSFYCTHATFSLFGSSLATQLTGSGRRTYANLGGQLDLKLVLFSLLESTLSFGYATAAEVDQRPSQELMVSLKLLR